MTDSADLSSLIGRLAAARVACVGDLMLDRFIEGAVERISPEGPIPVFAVRRETAMLGGAGDVLRNLWAPGAAAALATPARRTVGQRYVLLADTRGNTEQ